MLERTPYSAIVTTSYLNFGVVGISPLLTNNPEGMTLAKPRAKKGQQVYDPAVEAENGVYRTADGACCIKGIAFRSAILSAASAFKVKRFVTMKSLLSHIIVLQELCPLSNPQDDKPITSYEIDRRRVIVGKGGIVRARPRFNHWAAAFTIAFDRSLIDEGSLPTFADVVNDGGNRFGVGDYRPECSGWFGRFAVKDYAVSDNNEF
jgi:hypothetical protein